ncbi:FtsX-like permease family protein [Microcella sp.]|uniref:FtsX-like permease family protein n=1 Tax=Microcella sp. TaxID=1913979 RepID=UPI002565AC4F|nr:FtsX-like permease family protein [Microcella sp.]MBX9471582.1 hypothetical protein [Microcella sp.]
MSATRRILVGQVRSAGTTLVLLAALVGLAASLAVAVPLALADATSHELRSAISELSEERRDPSGLINDLTVVDLPIFSTAPATKESAYGSLFDALSDVRESQPEPLRSALGDAEVVIIGDAVPVRAESADADAPIFVIRSIVDPLLDERVRVVEGRLAEPWVPSAVPLPSGSLFAPAPNPEPPTPVELVLTIDGAEALRWSIGERRIDPVSEIDLVLVGIVDPIDADAAYWRGIPGAPQAERFDDGNQQPRETAAAFVNPLSVGAPTAFGPISVWYPLDVTQLDATTIDRFLPQLRSFLSTGLEIPLAFEGATQTTSASLTSEIPDAADAVLDRASVTTAVLALLLSGPLGALAVVLLLATRSTIDRRRSVLALQLARGASRGRLRLAVVRDALAVTMPAALVGAGTGVALALAVTGQTPSAAFAIVLSPPVPAVLVLIALLPGAMLAALLPRAADLRERRTDLAAPDRLRTLIELVFVALAALSVWLVLQRGIVTSAAEVGVDPLLVAMPLLLALATSSLTVRMYPVVVSAGQRAMARVGSAISVIGARRASRDRAAGVPVVVATVIAASVAVSSLSLLAVLDTGLDTAARDRLGAAVRVTGPAVGPDFVAALRALPESSATGGIQIVGPVVLGIEGVRENATIVTIDETTARLRDDAPVDWPSASATTEGAPVPVMLSTDLLPGVDGLPSPDAAIYVDGVPVTVVATGRRATGYGAPSSWVLVGEADAARFTSSPGVNAVLVEPSPGVSPAQLAGAITEVADSEARVSIAQAEAADERAVPLTAALRLSMLGAAMLAAALAIVTLVIASTVGRPRRQRVQSLALVLGVPRSSSLVAWELAPPSILGTIVGGLVGVALVPLATAAIDLRFVTGAADPVEASVDIALVVGVVGALLLGIVAVIALATALDRRPPLITALRTESP